ncbi:NnrS family protein [Gammaproteobacteria bacterium AB-CW1]|uniref:NnrS family protein n=1 Tax=Natronospira elongata TaxID=3110268 RepID=A0AAP6MLF7_9GAMM|nr:NnrS family protein [Gammaproteobacteria bacterium AB-CW1]
MSSVRFSLEAQRARWPVVLQQPFRLFFLAAAWFAVFHGALWGGMLASGSMVIEGNPFLWHGYHMVFGFAVAIVIGFLLTAAANWIGKPVSPPALTLGLFLAWCVARLGGFLPDLLPWALVTLADAVALWGACIALGVALLRAGNRRNYLFIAVLAALALAATACFLAVTGIISDIRFALMRIGLDLMLLLMVIMGQRIIPFFTERRLPHLGVRRSPLLMLLTPMVVAAGLLANYLGWPMPAMALMLSAAVLLLVHMTLWRSWGSWPEPMLWILHLGYLWLALALVLRAGSLGFGWMPYSTAGHAVSVGALGALGLGMLARVSLGHTGRMIQAKPWIVLAFVLVSLAAVFRLMTGFPIGLLMQWLFGLSALSWILAWLIFAISYAPILTGPRADGQPG